EQLVQLGFEAGRMKTGTPPRVDGRSLDYSKMEEQKGDEQPEKFSFSNETTPLKEQRSCFITYTNPEVHETLEKGFDRSPMFNGRIQGIGPRYCPSIEDKINRFAERNRHQIFVEPEGWDTVEIYVNGFSTSLPEDIQYEAIRKIEGFENVRMFRPGYAIEYDYFPPTQLGLTLETKLVENLFFAGQINGTTGYEEAACQGLVAGINAHRKIQDEEKFTLSRSEAYIGVLIDDLINKGTNEPYRMFTSRAEHRILLRQDNADLRLTERGYNIGLATEERLAQTKEKQRQLNLLINDLHQKKVDPDLANPMLESHQTAAIQHRTTLNKLVKRPQLEIMNLREINEELATYFDKYDRQIIEAADIYIKYEDYIDKEMKLAEKMGELDNVKISKQFNFSEITALSAEAREKLNKVRPETLGQASRISGVSPADISVLMVYMGR
ncbi:MAG: tRNA uridine-5-carboxymethylaminomethyl(34) synthesis enzyme MnmG, partial [Cytophagia bacterium]|nr:tRNA uridine-5-carboxymethylaminomethyl(34) synthesis enzyme MnmG [Cytophagia bacterium]